jgi:hypothetical protein
MNYPDLPDLIRVTGNSGIVRYALHEGKWATVYTFHVQGYHTPPGRTDGIGIPTVGLNVAHNGTPASIESAVREVLGATHERTDMRLGADDEQTTVTLVSGEVYGK